MSNRLQILKNEEEDNEIQTPTPRPQEVEEEEEIVKPRNFKEGLTHPNGAPLYDEEGYRLTRTGKRDKRFVKKNIMKAAEKSVQSRKRAHDKQYDALISMRQEMDELKDLLNSSTVEEKEQTPFSSYQDDAEFQDNTFHNNRNYQPPPEPSRTSHNHSLRNRRVFSYNPFF